MKKRGRGCLEIGAIGFFALVLGAFATSTILQHAGRDSGQPVAAAGPAAPAASVSRARIRVEVRNGSGIAGAAGRMTGFLRDRGFDVVDFGNAERFDLPRTRVIDRSGRPEHAREVAAALQGVPIETAVDSALYLDVTVLVGADLAQILGDPPEAERGGWRGWLDRVPRPWR